MSEPHRFGVFMGSGFSVLLAVWHWHKTTRLANDDETKH